MINDEQLTIFSDKNSLLSEAGKVCEKAEEIYRKSIRYYFIARYFVAVYESRNHEIPIQVWNEYRNALDHFFRWLTSKNNAQVIKMEGHMLRACLDILKLFIHATIEKYEAQRKIYPIEVYDLIDNGKFYDDFIKRSVSVSKKFEYAKVADSRLGESDTDDFMIINNYLDSAFEADTLMLLLLERETDFIRAQKTYSTIQKTSTEHSLWDHFVIHLKVHALTYIVITILGSMVIFDEIKVYLKNEWHAINLNNIISREIHGEENK